MIRPTLTAALATLALTAPVVAQDPRPQGPDVPADLKLYSEASLQMHRRNYEEAHALLGELIDHHPQSRMRVPALFWRGQCLEEMHRSAEAKAVYEKLVRAHGESGWAADARHRLAALAAQGPLVAKLSRKRGTLVLANGDRLSGRVVDSKDGEVIVEADGVGTLTMPRDRIAGVQLIEIDDDAHGKKGKSKTVVNADGSKTTTTVYPDGSKTVTTVRTTKDGKKLVEIERTTKSEGKGEHRIELKLDDDEDLEEHLRKLPGKLKLRIKKKLGDLDLEELEDLDLHLEGLEELEGLEGLEGLEDLPEKLRLKIGKSLKGLKGLKGLEGLKGLKGKRYVFKGDDDEEHVFPFDEEQLEKRIEIFKDQAKAWKDSAKGWQDYTKGWKDFSKGMKGLFKNEEGDVYAVPGLPGDHLWVDDQHGNVFFSRRNTKDRVFLRNGDKISGELLRVDEQHVDMKTDYGEVKIDRDQVRQIIFADVPKAFLGLVGGKTTDAGVLVEGVDPESAAAKAGLKKGDVITSVGGHQVAGMGRIGELIRKHKVGDTITIGVRRGEQTLELKATLGKMPERHRFQFKVPTPPKPPALPRIRKRIEKRLQKVVPRVRKPEAPKVRGSKPFLGISCDVSDRGVKIDRVMEGSVLKGSAQAGDVITHFKGKKITGVDQLIEMVQDTKPGAMVSLRLERGEGKVLELEVPMGSRPGPDAPKKAPELRKSLRQY